MRKIPWYLIVIVIFLGLYSVTLYMKPAKTNWTPTLANKDKIPYGTYVLFHELENMFSKQPKELRITPYEFRGDTTEPGTKEVYMFVNVSADFSSADVNALLSFVNAGNDLFISSQNLGRKMSDTLGLDIDNDYLSDSITTALVNSGLNNKRYYGMPKSVISSYLSKFDTSHAIVLGIDNKKRANFIMKPWGGGRIFINTVPGMYTNYSLLDQGNRDYVAGSLSYLIANPKGLYWDEYFKQGRVGNSSPLRVILEHPALRAAFYTALVAVIIFMLFQSKRRQRIIPVLRVPENSTVDFVETVSQVYFNNNNHRNIAMKQITYFFEHVRFRFQLETSVPDHAFAKRLARKSGYPEQEASKMMDLIRYIRSEEKISDQHLLKLNNYIQEFHKQSNR